MNKTIILFLLISTFSACVNQKETVDVVRPNVIVILADDQGWGDISFNGNEMVSTPNIDRLGKEGVSFDRFYVSPVCSPTRAEFLTGRYSPRSGVYSTSEGGEMMDLDEKTIAQVFREAGYTTAAFGKWHNGMQYPYHPNGRGFDEFYGFCSGHWGDYFDADLEHNGEIVKGEGYMPDDLTSKAIQFIENNSGKPFFVYLPFNTPHSPMQVPDPWYHKFKDLDLKKHEQEPQKENIVHSRTALAMTENIDWNIGRLIRSLQDLKLMENTILVYFTDNGPNGFRWNGDMKGIKGSTDEGGVRSPLFIYWQNKIPKGKKVEKIAAAIDLLPTLAELTEIELKPEKPLDGRSLAPLIFKEDANWEERLIFSHWAGKTSVRSQNYRLDHQNKLFDMVNDPGQKEDVSDQKTEEKQMLVEAKIAWEQDVFDKDFKKPRPFPVGHPDFKFTQLPARDGIPSGNIERSNRFPNCSFFTNWIRTEDQISWPVEVLSSGIYEVELYYTCPQTDVGSTFQLKFGENSITSKIQEAHDPPLKGMENDRVERMESYVKDFKCMNIGKMTLQKGTGELVLQAMEIPGKQVMDFRLLMFKKVE